MSPQLFSISFVIMGSLGLMSEGLNPVNGGVGGGPVDGVGLLFCSDCFTVGLPNFGLESGIVVFGSFTAFN